MEHSNRSYSLFSSVYNTRISFGPNPLEDGHLLPSLFVLLHNKTEATYSKMWEQINVLCPTAQPTHMIMNFELAAISSFELQWPLTNVKVVFFHLTQNLWRKIQSLGLLQSDYINDQDLATRLRMLPVLAFASSFDVLELFPQVIEELNIPEATELALYTMNRHMRVVRYLGEEKYPHSFQLGCGTTITKLLSESLVQRMVSKPGIVPTMQ